MRSKSILVLEPGSWHNPNTGMEDMHENSFLNTNL